MTHVFFAFGAIDKLHTACLIARKRFRSQQALAIWVPDPELRQELDARLWSFDPQAFIPHDCVYSPQEKPNSPVLLCSGNLQLDHERHIINLSMDVVVPQTFGTQIIEIVSQNEQDKEQARQRWRSYKQQGLSITQHNLNQGNANHG